MRVLNEKGALTNELLWHKEGRLFQKQNSQWTLNLNWNLNSKANNNQTTGDYHSPTEMQYSPFSNPNEILSENVDFSIPWNLTLGVNYSRLSSYIVSIAGYQTNQSATLTARGDLNLTSKWKIGFSSGYDFINKDFTYTSIDFYRDLHCWEMRMNWIPFGPRQGWNFSISVKAPMLQDLKYEKKKTVAIALASMFLSLPFADIAAAAPRHDGPPPRHEQRVEHHRPKVHHKEHAKHKVHHHKQKVVVHRPA